MPYRLFVYGTLRKDYVGAVDAQQRGPEYGPHYALLKPHARFECYAKVRGLLYDFGPYPGLVETQEPERYVFGEMYQVFNEKELWPALDDYEGCGEESPKPYLFVRRLTTAKLDSGIEQRCWAYYYGPAIPRSVQEITSGDFMKKKSCM